MKKIINVKALNDFALECTMDNGDVFRYDMSFVLDGPGEMLTALRKPSHFKKVFIELGSLSWPSGYEIHAETVARDGELIERQAS
jgi:hypothetical protein